MNTKNHYLSQPPPSVHLRKRFFVLGCVLGEHRHWRPRLPVWTPLFWLIMIRWQRHHLPVRGVKAAGDEPQTQILEVNDEVRRQLPTRYVRCLSCRLDNIIKTTRMSHKVVNEYQSTAENSTLTQPPCAPVWLFWCFYSKELLCVSPEDLTGSCPVCRRWRKTSTTMAWR